MIHAAGRPRAPASEDAIWFGDLHVHSTVSLDALRASVGDGSHPQADACDFARACARLDFFALTDHAENLTPPRWSESAATLRACDAKTDRAAPDLVPFLGWEWTQRSEDGGPWSVVLRDVPAAGASLRPLGAPHPDPAVEAPFPLLARLGFVVAHLSDPRAHDLARYFAEGARTDPADRVATPEALATRLVAWEAPALLIPPGAPGDPALAHLLELSTDEAAQALLARSARFGLVSGSDSHEAKPGSGGLAAVHAKTGDREALWDALARREVYATSGSRTRLWFDLVNAPGDRELPMGSEVAMRHAPRFRARAVGSPVETAPGSCWEPGSERHRIARIDVVRVRPQQQPDEPLGELIDDPFLRFECPPDPAGCQTEITDDAFAVGARAAVYYARALEDGQQRAWSSPIFVDYAAPDQAESSAAPSAPTTRSAGAEPAREIAPDEFDSEWSPAGDQGD